MYNGFNLKDKKRIIMYVYQTYFIQRRGGKEGVISLITSTLPQPILDL